MLGGAAALVAGGAEWWSLRGNFDHRRWPGEAGKERFDASLKATENGAPGIVHVTHSTHLISLAKTRLLTDPWFYDPAFGALSHDVKPAVAPNEIGPLNAILITHDHADHADARAIDQMDKRAACIVATKDLASRMRALGFADVSVLMPWQDRKVGDVTVLAVPGLHDIYEVGYVVLGGGKSVYFAGDSALHPDLPAIAERFRPDVAILPVDGTRLTGGGLHVMTPEDAVTAAKTLNAKLVMPSHDEAYFSDWFVDLAVASMVPHARQRFAELVARDLPGVTCKVPAPGELIAL